jgi:drug/metabolite transporter (DMT)-like permease
LNTSHATLKAAAWMFAALILMTLMAVSGRAVAREVDVLQAIEMRSLIALFFVLPLVYLQGGVRTLKTNVLSLHIGRNFAHYAGQYAWLTGLTLLPLAQVISIEFTAPIWAALLAAVLLNERLSWRKMASIIFGLLGVCLIVKPGTAPLEPGHVIVLGAALGYAISFITTKALTRTESATTILFWMIVVQAVIGLVPAVTVWVWPPITIMPWVIVLAFSGAYAHYCMARALALAEATVVMPMDYLRVPLSALVGYLLYSEGIDIYTGAGASLILLGNLFNLRRPNTSQEIASHA